MAQNIMSSEEALNGIFNILDTMIKEDEKEKKKKKEHKADETIIDLLQGIVETAKKDKTGEAAGQQLEALAKGLKSMKDVDTKTLETVSKSINRINKLLKELKVPDNIDENIENFINALNKLVFPELGFPANAICFIILSPPLM